MTSRTQTTESATKPMAEEQTNIARLQRNRRQWNDATNS
jgi:hypothetical protein